MILIQPGQNNYTHRVPRPLTEVGDYLLLEFWNPKDCVAFFSVQQPQRCKQYTDVVFDLSNKECGYYLLNIWQQVSDTNLDPSLADSHFVVNLGVQLVCPTCSA
jgi:hypothetical protein